MTLLPTALVEALLLIANNNGTTKLHQADDHGSGGNTAST
jgi:hypothetical protein